MDPYETVAAWLRAGGAARTTPEEGYAVFDALPPVRVEEILGSWRGHEVASGHPMEGLLKPLGWHGKTFADAETAYPVEFGDPAQGLDRLNTALVPFRLMLKVKGLLVSPLGRAAFRLARPVWRTKRPKARLRMVEQRGVVSAAMVFNDLPIFDCFRKVDEATLFGLMDRRGMPQPYFFILTRA